MARNDTFKIIRGTRAALDALAAGSGLIAGEPYLITDERRIAVGLTTSTYNAHATQDEIDASDFASGEMAMASADLLNVAQLFGRTGNRFADPFDTLTYVDVAGATNLDSSVAGVLKPSLPLNLISAAAGTVTNVNMANSPTAAFDGVTSQAVASSASVTGGGASSSGYNQTLGKDWGSGVTKTVAGFKVYGPNDNALFNGGANTVKLQGSVDGVGYTDLYTSAAFGGAANALLDVTSGITTTTAYRFHRVAFNGNGVNGIFVAEVQFYELGAANNLTVRAANLTITAAPTAMKAILQVKEVDAATAGTDYTLECSRDGGTTWAAMTLTERYTKLNGLRAVEAARTSVAGQPSGTFPRWRFKTFNNKMIELHDIYLAWE